MTLEHVEQTVDDHFGDEIDEGRNIYFQIYYSNKSVDSVDFIEILSRELRTEEVDILESNDGQVVIQIENQPVVVLELSYGNWLFIFTSVLSNAKRRNLRQLSNRIGWLMEAWVPSDTVEDLYKKYADEREKVRIKRRWDPYYLYQNYSNVPSEMQQYYEENLDDFEEQKTEFSLKTPRRMVDEVIDRRLKDDFIQRSEVAESRFNVHLSNPGDAAVTVDQNGSVIHRSGTPNATIKVLTHVQEENERLHSEFSEVVPEREYQKTEAGMVSLESYQPPKILRLTFADKAYNEEASIKLSNLLTVGQNDADFHGFISSRDGLEFRCRTYVVFDQSEYEILFTEFQHHPTLYIRPVEATVDGIIYLYHKVREKFDTRVERDIIEEEEFSQEDL
jgi:hypothetical protein